MCTTVRYGMNERERPFYFSTSVSSARASVCIHSSMSIYQSLHAYCTWIGVCGTVATAEAHLTSLAHTHTLNTVCLRALALALARNAWARAICVCNVKVTNAFYIQFSELNSCIHFLPFGFVFLCFVFSLCSFVRRIESNESLWQRTTRISIFAFNARFMHVFGCMSK